MFLMRSCVRSGNGLTVDLIWSCLLLVLYMHKMSLVRYDRCLRSIDMSIY